MYFKKVYSINFVLIFFCAQIDCVSFVYNLKIAETTKSQKAEKNGKPSIGALTFVSQFRERRDCAKENINGGLATLLYTPKNFYLRADFAFGNVKQRIGGIQRSITQTDDILFSAGVSKSLTEKTKFTFSGLFGIPTHKNLEFTQGIQFGTGHFGLGVQADGSFFYAKHRKHLILGAARFLYFVPRTVDIKFGNIEGKLDVNLGNVVDLYFAHQSIWKKNKIEIGYNATFGFGASIQPSISIIEDTTFIRSSFFASYAHGFLIRKHIAGIIAGASYGFDQTPKKFGYKSILSLWLSGAINF